MRRRRRGLNPALEYAVEAGYFDSNPLARIKRKHVGTTNQVDPRVLVNPQQARELLAALSYVGGYRRARGRRLVAFFATLYYAGPRPAEALGLVADQCELPGKGWGLLTFGPTLPVAGKQWTNSGERHDRRGLKQRDPDDDRPVPVPPQLVRILREHIDTFGLAADGRLFFNERRGILGSTTYSRAWEEARSLALTPARWPPAGRAAVRPASRGADNLAQRGRTTCRGGKAGRQLGGSAVEAVRRLHRRATGRHQPRIESLLDSDDRAG